MLAAFTSALVQFGCEEPPTGEELAGPPPPCAQCHKLTQPNKQVPAMAPREWMQAQGRGLVRKMTLILSDTREFSFNFPGRGYHPQYADAQCMQCHPVSGDGARHGISQYPLGARGLAFTPGQSCASSCHTWLGTLVKSEGFTSSKGTKPSYKGSLLPHDLLVGGGDAHGQIFFKGYTKPQGAAISIGRLKPGCVGCHSVRNDKHGTTAGCLECHKFGKITSKLHTAHVASITQGRATNDPSNAKLSTCDYCHGLSAATTTLKNAACYNCHLSGHQVLAKGGRPHFWP